LDVIGYAALMWWWCVDCNCYRFMIHQLQHTTRTVLCATWS